MRTEQWGRKIKRKREWIFLLSMMTMLFSACGGVFHPPGDAPEKLLSIYTTPRVDTMAHFFSLASPSAGKLTSVKFLITDFQSPIARTVHFMDGHFYVYHDEWYWYLRLNGKRALGKPPVADAPGCENPRACADWVRTLGQKPMGLSFVDDRLYSAQFYSWALSKHRGLGLGALLWLPETTERPATMAFRLEYTDTPTAEDVLVYFAVLRRSIEPSLAATLQWVTRSPMQEQLAAVMVASGQLKASQVISFAALAEAGEAEIYHGGITAGRLTFVDGELNAMAASDSAAILVVERPPDELPPSAGLISAVPMTPLSHINLLAQNRGIPSVYVGGVLQDDYVKQLADGHAPVLLDARGDEVRLRVLTEAQYKQLSNAVLKIKFNETADYQNAPYIMTPHKAREYTGEDKNALIGGKASGFELLVQAVPDNIPADVLFITTRAYMEHMAPQQKELETLLQHPAFLNSTRVRFFVLEGKTAFEKVFPTEGDKALIVQLKRASPLHYQVGMNGGVKGKIRARAMAPKTLAALTEALRTTFGRYPQNQGLRFRSSSTVEDIEGFNGAGLYISSTGFLSDKAVAREDGDARTVQWAMKRTWASYWNFQAFEEREHAGIDHMTGAMGMVVHPRFDDDFELANGVVTFWGRDAQGLSGNVVVAQMDVNVQRGALSVTNPPSDVDALPESLQVQWYADGTVSENHLQPSVVDGEEAAVLSEAEVAQLRTLCRRIFDKWRAERNVSGPSYDKSEAITLDIEFRLMAPAWSGHGEREMSSSGLIIKQVRSLESTPNIAEILDMKLAAPRDLLLRATQVSRRVCADDQHQLSMLEMTLDADDSPAQETRFISDVSVVVDAQLEVLAPHDYYQSDNAEVLSFADEARERLGIEQLDFSQMVCQVTVLARTDDAMLRNLAAEGQVIGRAKNRNHEHR